MTCFPLVFFGALFLLVTNVQTTAQKPFTRLHPRNFDAKNLANKFIPTSVDIDINRTRPTTTKIAELTHDRWTVASTARNADEQSKTLAGISLNTAREVTQPQEEAHFYVNNERMAKCSKSSKHSPSHKSKLNVKPHKPKPFRREPDRPPPIVCSRSKCKPTTYEPRSYEIKPPPLPPKPTQKTDRPKPTGSHSMLGVPVDYELFALKGLIEIEVEPGSHALGGSAQCNVMVRVPTGMYILFKVLKAVNVQAKNMDYSLSDENKLCVHYRSFANEQDFEHRPVFPSFSHTVVVDISVNANDFTSPSCFRPACDKFEFQLQFEVLHRSGLEFNFISDFAGFVQTPHYERSLPTYVLHNAFVDVIIPSGHIIMVSFPWSEVVGSIELKDVTESTKRLTHLATRILMLSACKIPSTKFFNKLSQLRVLRVTFTQKVNCLTSVYTFESKRSTGFRMWFSFHNKSSMPERTSDGKWNCSVPYWPAFRNHLLCNFQTECSGKEDEVGCRYTTEHCGPGYFQAGDACLFLERLPSSRYFNPAWVTGSDLCLRRGGRLASLKTRQRYNDVRRILHLQITQNYFYIGLKGSPSTHSLWYRSIYQWTDGTMAFHTFSDDQKCERDLLIARCGHISFDTTYMEECEVSPSHDSIAICERILTYKSSHSIVLPKPAPLSSGLTYVTCPFFHVTHVFLACDVQSDCFSQDYETCSALMTPRPPSFRCRNLVQNIPYTLVCDHRSDCADSSDEDFCVFQGCGFGQYSCRKEQCIPSNKHCDGWRDCVLGEDEMKCEAKDEQFQLLCLSPPALVDIGQKGMFIYKPLDNSSLTPNNTHAVCPESHFQCPNNGYCLPVFLRCNDVFDCTYHEDEADCDIYTCPGFYQCRASKVCVHQGNMCDGRPHCPQRDDELLCDLKCPVPCVCRGLAFFCTDAIHAVEYPTLRYLDARGTNMTLDDLQNNHILIFLSLAHCSITDLGEGHPFPNLISLDISDNYLTSIENALMNNLPHVKELFLSGNPVVHVLDSLKGQFPQVQVLGLSRVYIPQLNVSMLTIFPNLRTLNLSQSGIDKVLGRGFRDLRELRMVDLRGCPIAQFPGEMFQGLTHLQNVYAQSFHICCPVVLPANFNLRKCIAPIVDVSSCENLLGSVVYKVSTCVFAFFALVANFATLVYRTVINKSKNNCGFSVFVTHLSLSNFLMGVYLVIVILADWSYNGIYLWKDISWRHSTICSIAGFLLMMSNEASAIIMVVITFDRFLVCFFPVSRLQFDARSAKSLSCIIWILTLLLNSVPLLPVTSHWQIYSQTGICTPWPISRTDFRGRVYFFSIVIVFNFTLFILIGLGQVFIYSYNLRLDSISLNNSTQKNKDMAIARRFVTVAMSDFLCWFTIGLLGLLASSGFPVSDQINVGMTMFVMPLNSALNPFLYAANVISERRRRARVEKLRKIIMAQLSK